MLESHFRNWILPFRMSLRLGVRSKALQQQQRWRKKDLHTNTFSVYRFVNAVQSTENRNPRYFWTHEKKLFILPGFCRENPNHKIIGIKWIHISFDSWRGRNESLLEFLKWNRWHGPCWVKTFDGNSLRQVCNLAWRQNSGDSYFGEWMYVTMENFGTN